MHGIDKMHMKFSLYFSQDAIWLAINDDRRSCNPIYIYSELVQFDFLGLFELRLWVIDIN